MIYWDHNAGAPLRPEVAERLAAAHQRAVREPGNPSSVHQGGRALRARLETARASVAAELRCSPKGVVFTGSGSESVVLALKGAYAARPDRARTEVVCSRIEHPAVLSAVADLEATGATVHRVSANADGRVEPASVEARLTERTALCTLMWANNETGVLQPVFEVAQACRARGVLFHTDAVQAVGKTEVNLTQLDADLVSFSSHKLGGPAGVGALVVRPGVSVDPLVRGHQEDGRRGGTPDVAAIEAMALALSLARAEQQSVGEATARVRDAFEARVLAQVPTARVWGEATARVPNTSSLCFPGVDAETLLIGLDLAGVCVSTGAACASGSLSPSHVLIAMGLAPALARSTLRFSLPMVGAERDLDAVVAALTRQLEAARQAS